MADYGRLKWADDKRWTNVRKRGTYKALAEASDRTNDAEWLADDKATAERLADAKRSTAALYRAFGTRDDVVVRLLPDEPLAGRAAYCRMESAAAAERSLREKLVRGRYQLDECRHRVANMTARLAELKASVAAARESVPAKPPRRPPVLDSALILDKKVDALKLGNLKAAKARDIIANNTAMRDALNEQLASDVRQQATAVIELLTYGTAAKQEAVAYNREYCRVVGEHEHSVRRNNAKKRMLDTRISVLESNRRKMLINQIHNGSDEDVEFDTGQTMPSIVSDLDTSNKPGDKNLMLLKDWIDTGQLEKQISMKENVELSHTSDVINSTDSFTSSNTDNYTFPEEKVILYKFRKGESSRAMEAVEYVCETLNFSNITEVLHYFTSVKNVEMRIKKMISTRKHILEVVQKNLESVNEVKMDSLNRLPVAILKLNDNIQHVQREGLEVQKKQFEDVNRHITGYNVLFNELWFQLDNLVGKLERCHVPVVRKYQLHMKNPANNDSEARVDARQLLEVLERLKPCTVIDEDCTTAQEPLAVKSVDSTPGCRTVDVSGKNPAVDACRKLSETLYAKVKSCMVHIGGVFDANDKNQVMARACFAYDRQTQLQLDNIATKDRKRQTQASLQLPVGKAKASATDSRATGIMTRVQTKQQAEDIVQWCITPKDTDDARRTRKPISFRKSRIVVPERKNK